jgi:hypothetical protein
MLGLLDFAKLEELLAVLEHYLEWHEQLVLELFKQEVMSLVRARACLAP